MSMNRRNQKIVIPFFPYMVREDWTEEMWYISQIVFLNKKTHPNEDRMVKITFSILIKMLKGYPTLKKALKRWY